ncbi:TetR/AcrR family transcriptional regulator [Actinomadura rupiterrae]|uniref:TetR/AcrR family transcriptional regulator n=1 Tax=Actinomadura rupiterrae TaxID=559627 RepID=UPI0020A493B7|nr:TetR family transcriptional regulator [Actinomadura rupiterrae]MCP2336546.1 AcrR family transcriptional regulator [Actinomadura rupiterrae]
MPDVKSRRAKYSEETRNALLDAATRRFAEHGFAGTSLEDVAADIRATRGAVYHHFASKTALFQAVFERLEERSTEAILRAAADAPDAWTAAVIAQNTFLDHCREPVYGRIVWQEGPIALGWKRWRECEERFGYGVVEQMVASLQEAGLLPPLPRGALARVAFHVLGAAGTAVAEAPDEDKDRLRGEYAEVLTEILGGLRTDCA